MAKGEHRVKLGLVCSICKNRNYITKKNKLNSELKSKGKLLIKKFCSHCKKHTDHKETEKLK